MTSSSQPPFEAAPPGEGVRTAGQPAVAEAGASSAGHNHLPAIPGYELLGKLGAGGMGIVYKGRHVALNRLVAIKVLNRIQQATEREILRLQMEGETVANLQHPNIVPLYQMGEFAGLPFLTFEYIDGGTLAERIAGRPQPPREAAQMVELLSRAVQLAHQQGVLHRDLKPANVLLSKDGVPKIADFGLARRLDNHEFSTELIAGTANYMSPEQAWGDSKTNPLTPATDVYSLGAILYELLTGRPPFASDSREETIKDVWSKPPASPRSLAPDVPPDLQTVCLKCLEKEPNRRYSSAAELADDLKRWLNSEPIIARPSGRFERAVLWCRRDPVFAGLLIALIVAILVGGSASSWLAWNYRAKRDEALVAESNAKQSATVADNARAAAEEKQKQLTTTNDRLAATNDQLERRLYEAMILTTARDVELMTRDPHGLARVQLAEHLRQCPLRLRNIEWQIRNRQLQGSLLTRPVTRHNLAAMAVSNDGKWVATGAINMEDYLKGESVRVWSTHDWQLRASLGRHGQRLAFSPDAQLLVFDTPSTGTEIWNWREHRLLRTFPHASAPLQMDEFRSIIFHPVDGVATFSPDGRHLAIGLANTVQVYPLGGGNLKDAQVERTLSTGAVIALQYSPDSRRLVVLAYLSRAKATPHAWQAELQVWDTTTSSLIRKMALEGTFKLMSLSPDGRTCAVASVGSNLSFEPVARGNELRLYNLDDGQFRKIEASTDRAIGFSRDGRTLLLDNHLIDLKDSKFKSSLVGHLGTGVVGVDSLPDGRILTAGADGMLKVWPRDGQSRLPHWYDGMLPFALSHDGRELAVAQPDGTVRRFDLNDNRELVRLPAQEFQQGANSRFDASQLPKALGIGGLCYSTTSGQLLVVYSDLVIRTWQLDDVSGVASLPLIGPGVSRPDPLMAHGSGLFSANSPIPRIVFSDDGKYAAWDGYGQQHTVGAPATTLMVWDVATGRTIVNEQERIWLGADPLPKHLVFATIRGATWAVIDTKMPRVEVPGRPSGLDSLSSGWELPAGKHRFDSDFERELREARGSRSIDAWDVLTITDSASGMTLLQLPLGATAAGRPALSSDRSRLAVATNHGIAVFDVGPMPELELPDDRPVPESRTGPPSN